MDKLKLKKKKKELKTGSREKKKLTGKLRVEGGRIRSPGSAWNHWVEEVGGIIMRRHHDDKIC